MPLRLQGVGDITGAQCIRSDRMLVVSDKDYEIAWKSYHEKLLSTDLAQNSNSLSKADSVSSLLRVIDKYKIRGSIKKIKHLKAAGPSDLV